MPNPTLILPYVVEDKARKKPFTLDMEISALLCLAEAQRKKPRILGASSEKISFILKLHYPIWFVPWKGLCLVVDGLEFFSHTLPYVKLPDVEFFAEGIQGSAVDKNQFRHTLKKHIRTFEKPESTSISFEAIFAEKEILSFLGECFEQVSTLKEKRGDLITLIPPRINEKTALTKAEKAVELWRQIQSDIKGLQYAIDILNEQTSFEEEMILHEIEHVRELYEAKIAPLRPIVEEKIEKLILKRDTEIAKLDKSMERKLTARSKEKRRHERELERLERNLIEYKKRRKMSKRRGNNIGATKWEHRMTVYENKLSEARRKLQSVLELIDNIKRHGEREVQGVNASYQFLVDNERKKILDLEKSRRLEAESRKMEIEEIKADASIIVEQILRFVELKRTEASRIEEVTVAHGIEKTKLLCIPFYLVRYETKEKTKYLLFPPTVAMDFRGIRRKLQKAIRRFSLQSRIKLLLRLKSTALERILGKILLEKIRSDDTLEKVVYELGVSNNILQSSDFKEILTKGIEKLRIEGWISREEKEAVLKTYL